MNMLRSSGADFWRELVGRLDEGVIIFDRKGVAVYANDEATRLLGYQPGETLDLDKDDFLSLCQTDRLDEAQFAHALRAGRLPASPCSYSVVTAERRLRVTLFSLDVSAGYVEVLLLREITHWRDELIAQAALEEMNSPLAFASSYCETLLHRLEEGWAHPFELQDLARIIRDSVNRAAQTWETLNRLQSTGPDGARQWTYRPISLPAAIRAALRELNERAIQGLSGLRLEVPGDLPPVRASEPHLHMALCALLGEAAAHLSARDQMVVTARNRQAYVQVDLITGTAEGVFRAYLFDVLPLAIAEQVIIRHGGRIWFGGEAGGPPVCSFSLPVWVED